jgi:hypothetical protein
MVKIAVAGGAGGKTINPQEVARQSQFFDISWSFEQANLYISRNRLRDYRQIGSKRKA